jgi:hypothetical protein
MCSWWIQIALSNSKKAVSFSSARTMKTLSVAAIRVANPDRSPRRINS